MSITTKPLDEIRVDDLRALIEAEARETTILEFKGALPVPKGSSANDRWIEKGDRIGDYARDELLAEVVAFANADGGTLILGVEETSTEPRCARRLSPLPQCERLAKRLLDASEDIVEPRLAAIHACGLSIDETGQGFVLIRTGKSLFGPHRLTTTREFYARRGERCSKMTAREIRDHSFNLARSADQVAALFQERIADAGNLHQRLQKNVTSGSPPRLIRVSAAPMSPQCIDSLTRLPNLWWVGKEFDIKVDDQTIGCRFPARDFRHRPDFRLRSFVYDNLRQDAGFHRLLNSKGLVEFSLQLPWGEGTKGQANSHIYYAWIFSLVVGVFAQVKHLQAALGWDAVDFGLNVSIFGRPPLNFRWTDGAYGEMGNFLKTIDPLILPLYEITATSNVALLLEAITHDISNACGISLSVRCHVPSDALNALD